MKVLVCVCTHEMQHVGSIRTAYGLKQREGDKFTDEWRSRGDVAREMFVDYFLKDNDFGAEDGVLLLDGDQRHPHRMLEHLRDTMEAHNLDMVCAHYYRRETSPIQSLCYELGDGTYPFLPYLDPPTRGLHEIAWTGFGSVLIKKKVLQAVAATLPPLASPVAIGPLPEATGDYDNVGPDLRFFYKARQLGFKLWLDADMESLHGVTLWLGHQSAKKLVEYGKWADATTELWLERTKLHGMTLESIRQRDILLEARRREFFEQVNEIAKARDAATSDEERQALIQQHADVSVAIYQLDGRRLELKAWTEALTESPPITQPRDLPTTQTMPEQKGQGVFASNDAGARRQAYSDQAVEMLEMLPDSNGHA